MGLEARNALRFSDYRAEPDLVPTDGIEPVRGFSFNKFRAMKRSPDAVEPACYTTTAHDFGSDKRTRAQRAIDIYSTRLLALKALREACEIECAEILAFIDTQIQRETSDSA